MTDQPKDPDMIYFKLNDENTRSVPVLLALAAMQAERDIANAKLQNAVEMLHTVDDYLYFAMPDHDGDAMGLRRIIQKCLAEIDGEPQ